VLRLELELGLGWVRVRVMVEVCVRVSGTIETVSVVFIIRVLMRYLAICSS